MLVSLISALFGNIAHIAMSYIYNDVHNAHDIIDKFRKNEYDISTYFGKIFERI